MPNVSLEPYIGIVDRLAVSPLRRAVVKFLLVHNLCIKYS